MIRTTFKKGVISEEIATELFNKLKINTEWEEGIRSRKGKTRKAKALAIDELEDLNEVIALALSSISSKSFILLGVYLNYYENGESWTPNHSHKGTAQLVISLGAPRTLVVGKKEILMENGDAIIFGSAVHGVPKSTQTEGRISIATFMKLI